MAKYQKIAVAIDFSEQSKKSTRTWSYSGKGL